MISQDGRILWLDFFRGGWRYNFDICPNGRIGILWNPKKVSLRCMDRHPQSMSFEVSSLTFGFVFALSGVFGFYLVQERHSLWDHLTSFASSWNGPWMVCGDFNCILSPNERIGRQVFSREIRDFRDFCDNVDLRDSTFTGCFYTFLRANMRSRIDRVLLNGMWQGSLLSPVVDFSSPGNISDHCRGLIRLGHTMRTRGRFHFANMWTKHPDFLNIVRDNWFYEGPGYKQFQLCRKLAGVRKGLRTLNKDQFARIFDRAEQAEEALQSAQAGVLSVNPDDAILGDIPGLAKEARRLRKAAISFAAQRAKTNLFAFADKPTRFFYDMVKRGNRRNPIPRVIKRDGEYTRSPQEVAAEFLSFYEELLGTEDFVNPISQGVIDMGQRLDQEMAQGLGSFVTDEEIKIALWSIDDLKTAGPDGFSARFFKSSWEIVGEDVIAAVREFFQSGRLLTQINYSIISLIPKGGTQRTLVTTVLYLVLMLFTRSFLK